MPSANEQFSGILKEKIKNYGFRLTASREAVLKVIANSDKSLPAEDIFIKIHKKDKKIGVATVYRALRLLEKFGLIKKSLSIGNKARYCLNIKNESTSDIKETYDAEIKYKNNSTGQIPVLNKTNTIEEFQTTGNSNYSSSQKTTNYEHISGKGVDFKYGYDISHDTDKINRMQSQLNDWMNELNKIKREKETNLEEIINDFSKLDKILEKHQYSKNNLIQMLIDFQIEYNWLPKHVLFYVGKKIELPLTQVYSIASFYKFFNLEPRGKYQIVVCTGTACHVRGSANLLQRIVNILKIKPGDTTPDYRFTLDTVNCLGCCALGPVMLFNGKYHSDPSSRMLEKLFDTAD